MIKRLNKNFRIFSSGVIVLTIAFFPLIGKSADKDPHIDVNEVIQEISKITVVFPQDDFKIEILMKLALIQAKAGYVAEAQRSFQNAISIVETLSQSNERSYVSTGGSYLLKRLPWNIYHLIGIASTQMEIGDQTAKITLQKALQASNNISNFKDKFISLEGISLAQSDIGDFSGANETLEYMFNIIPAEDALYYRAKVFLTKAKVEIQEQRVPSAKESLKNTVEIANGIRDPLLKAEVFQEIAVIHASIGNQNGVKESLNQALEAIAGAQDKSRSPSHYKVLSLVKVADAFAKRGDHDSAEKSIDQALKVARTLRDSEERSAAFQYIVIAHAKAGNIKDAVLAQEAVNEDMHKMLSLSYIAEAQIKSGNIKGASLTAHSLMEKDFPRGVVVVENIAKSQVENGDVEGALKSLEILGKGSNFAKASVLEVIAKERMLSGDTEVLEWAMNQPEVMNKVYALFGIAQGLAERKR